MNLGHRPLIWKNGRVPSNHIPSAISSSGPGLCRAVVPYIHLSEALSEPSLYIILINHSLLRSPLYR